MRMNLATEELRTIFNSLACEYREIRLVYFFGSRIDGYSGPLSDHDFGVFCDHTADRAKLRTGVYHRLVTELGTVAIDIVVLNDTTIEFAFAVISHGQLLFERDVKTRVDYEARIMGLYFDYLPLLRMGRRETLEGADHATRVQRYREAFGRTERTLRQIRGPQR